MAPSKLAILSIFLALIFSQIRAAIKPRDGENSVPVKVPLGADSSGTKGTEFKDKLKAKFHYLVLNRGVKKEQKKNEQRNGASPEEGEKVTKELIENWGIVIQEMLNSIVQENSDIISSLRSEIKSLQKNGSLVEQSVGKAHAHADELEKKVNELEMKLQLQRKEKEGLEARANVAEKKIDDLLLKIENIEKTNDEQETKIRKTEHAYEVEVAEVEMRKAKFEATLKEKELNEVQGTVKDLLKWHELIRPLTPKELEWFAALPLLALPFIILLRIFSSLFCKKTKKKPVRVTNHAS